MADIPSRKPILTIEQQIEHLRRKGVSFELCSEAEAARILAGQDGSAAFFWTVPIVARKERK